MAVATHRLGRRGATGFQPVGGSRPGYATADSQDGCRYTSHQGRRVATGFQPVGRSRPGTRRRRQPGWLSLHIASPPRVATGFQPVEDRLPVRHRRQPRWLSLHIASGRVSRQASSLSTSTLAAESRAAERPIFSTPAQPRHHRILLRDTRQTSRVLPCSEPRDRTTPAAITALPDQGPH